MKKKERVSVRVRKNKRGWDTRRKIGLDRERG